MDDSYFEIFSGGKGHISGYVSFWRSGKHYYQQSIGLTAPRRISKARYDHAKELYEKGLPDDGTLVIL